MKNLWRRRAARVVEQDTYRLHKLAMKEDPSQLREMLVGNAGDIDDAEKGMLHTPLMLAVQMERVESVDMLLAHGADPNRRNIEGMTALHLLPERQPIAWTGIENKLKIAASLLRHGADLAVRDQYGGQPLWYAVFHVKEPDDVQLVEMYVMHGADPRYRNEQNGQSPLDFARKVAYPPLVDVLERR